MKHRDEARLLCTKIMHNIANVKNDTMSGCEKHSIFNCNVSIKLGIVNTQGSTYRIISLHPLQKTSRPEKLSDGHWNCSVPFWSSFRTHFLCNRHRECVHGEDEQGCPYTLCKDGGDFFLPLFVCQGEEQRCTKNIL